MAHALLKIFETKKRTDAAKASAAIVSGLGSGHSVRQIERQ
jgi:hypothetical protein